MIIKYDVEEIQVHAGTKQTPDGPVYVVTIEAQHEEIQMPTIWLEFKDPQRAARVMAGLGKEPVYFNHKRAL